MARTPDKQFGKRPPPAAETARPAKRSGYVGLFLMGTVAVGAGAYAMMPSEQCEPTKPPAAGQPATQSQSCRTSSRSGGYSYGGRSSGSRFYDSSSSSSSHSSSGGLTTSTTSRGGFGGFGHAIAASFSRGG